MSSTEESSSDEERSTARFFVITKKDKFQDWQEQTLARAREKGFAEYFTTDTTVHPQSNIENAQATADAEPDPARKKVL